MTTMLQLVQQLPEQLRWAADLQIPDTPSAQAAIVTGMGGSGIAGDVAAVVAEEAGRRVVVHKSYDLPRWVGSEDLVVAVSHSGNTEETATSVSAALAGGFALVGVTTGGAMAERAAEVGFSTVVVPPCPQPRAAFGHLVGATLRVLESAGIVGPQSEDLREAADVTGAILDGEGPETAARLAEALAGRMTVVYGGSGPASVAANRWKTQINENAKAPAAWVPLPEADHNDIVGWTAHPDFSASSFGAVFLSDSGDHPRVSLRGRLTRRLMEGMVDGAEVVASRGISTVARLFSLTVVGDLVSLALAERSASDPMPVDIIEDFKIRLAGESE